MENNEQPNQPTDSQPIEQQPINPPIDSQATTPSVDPQAEAPGETTPVPPVSAGNNYPPSTGEQNDIILQSNPNPKKNKGLIISIIVIVALLLIGGGGFFAAYAIANQPNNILASAANNYMKAIKTGMASDTTMTIDFDADSTGVDSIEITERSEMVNSNIMATADVKAVLADDQELSFQISEYVSNEGEIYLKFDGLNQIYSNNLRDQISSMVKEQLKSELPMTNMAEEAHINGLTMQITNKIGQIVDTVDGDWIRANIEEILESDLVADMGIDSATRQVIISAYKCVFDKIAHIDQYSDDILGYYNENPFVTLTAGQDSFYNISFDDTNLANFVNVTPKMKLVGDIAQCVGFTIPSDTSLGITASDVSELTGAMNNVYSVKFDGIFDHRIAEMKGSVTSQGISVSVDSKYSYPSNISISTPTDSTPVMDVVEQVMVILDSFSELEPSTSAYVIDIDDVL